MPINVFLLGSPVSAQYALSKFRKEGRAGRSCVWHRLIYLVTQFGCCCCFRRWWKAAWEGLICLQRGSSTWRCMARERLWATP